MQTELLKAYRAERASNRGGYLGQVRAADALRSARYNLAIRGADFPRYCNDTATLELPRGERIEMGLQPDNDADIFERMDCEAEGRAPDDVADNACEGWQDRDGCIVWDRNGSRWGRDWRLWESGYSLAQRIADRRKYMSRHAAWLDARRSIARDFNYFLRVLDAGYVGYVATLYDAGGDEVGSDSCWGFEADGDYAGLECLDAARCMAEQRAEYWAQEVEKARANMRLIRGAFAALAREYRAARNVGPAVCDAIRARLESMRADYRANLRVLAGGAA